MKQKEMLEGVSRRKRLIDILDEQSQVRVKELAERFMVSEMTIRRDLHYLEEIGVAQLHYGGAALRRDRLQFPSFSKRGQLDNPAKKAIGRKAASYLRDGDTVFMDVSTTVLQMVRYLPDIKLKIITNSLPVIESVYLNPRIELLIAPGHYQPEMAGMADLSTLEYLQSFHVDKAFIGVLACKVGRGILCSSEIEAAIKRHMIDNAEQSFLLMDHSKFGAKGTVFQGGLDEPTYILTDAALDEELMAAVKRENKNLIICHL